MTNQPTGLYTVNDLKQLIGIDEQKHNSVEKPNAAKYLVGQDFNESCISFCILTEYPELRYLYVSPKIELITGHRVELLERGGLAFMFTLIHPAEMSSLRSIHQKIFSFFQSLPIGEKLDYCYCYNIRIRMANGEYIRLLCEFEGEALYPDGLLFIGREIFTEITQFDSTSPPTLVIRHKHKMPGMPEQVFHFDNHHQQPLTRREKEICACVATGKTSKEIAEELHLSIHTVETHRRRISRKRKQEG